MAKQVRSKYSFPILSTKQQKRGLVIEGFANRAVKDGADVIDRGKEHIPTSEWNIKEFQENPIIFFNHDRDMPIGKALSTKVTPDGLKMKVLISNSKDPVISKVRDLIEEGILQTFSVGIDVGSEEQKSDGTITLKNVNLLETSVVSIPMNQESFFQISKSYLKDTPSREIAVDIANAKGAWVAAAIHQRIFDLQKEDPDFNRPDALTELATAAEVSQDELLDVLAGNTVSVEENILKAASAVLGIDIELLTELNDGDKAVADPDDQLRPEDKPEEEETELEEDEEEELAEEEDPDEELQEEEEEEEKALEEEEDTEELQDDEEEEKQDEEEEEEKEDEEEEEKAEDEEEEEDKQADQGDRGTEGAEPLEEPEEPRLALEDEAEANAEAKQDTNTASFQDCVAKNIREALDAGKNQDQAIAFALSECRYKILSKADWEAVFKTIDEYNEEKKEKQIPDETGINLGNKTIQALHESNLLAAQAVSELKGIREALNGMFQPPQEEEGLADVAEDEGEDEQLLEDEVSDETEELADDSAEEAEEERKQLDKIRSYRQELKKKLSALNV